MPLVVNFGVTNVRPEYGNGAITIGSLTDPIPIAFVTIRTDGYGPGALAVRLTASC
jgi:hypothetical protein